MIAFGRWLAEQRTFGISPCREIGEIKNAIKDAILDGIIHNDYDEAYRFMLDKGKELGLKPQPRN